MPPPTDVSRRRPAAARSRRQLLRLLGAGALAAAALAACQRPPSTPVAPPTPAPSEPSPALPPPAPTEAATASPIAPPSSSTASAPSPTAAGSPTAVANSPTAAATPGTRIYLPQTAREPSPAAPPPSPTPVPTARPAPSPTAAPAPPPAAPPGPTNTPRPTPPPYPTAGERVAITKATKWGIGAYRESNEIFDDLYTTKPGVILLMDPSPGWARRVREWFPRAFLVARRFRAEIKQPLDNPGPRGVAFADAVAEHAVPLRGVVDAWMSYNEVVNTNQYEQYRQYNEFQVAFARRLQDVHGVAAVAANDGSATVEPFDYPKYFADAIRASRYFGLHAYSPLGSHRMRDQAEWHALRYRKIHDELARAGIPETRMVITESGLGDGWRDRVDDVQMVEEFFWFTDELEKDPYMIGHASYGLFGDGTWPRFEMRGTDILTRMGYYEPPSRRPPPKP